MQLHESHLARRNLELRLAEERTVAERQAEVCRSPGVTWTTESDMTEGVMLCGEQE